MIDFYNLHVGLTNRCRLLCPECTRNSSNNKYIQNLFDMDIEHFKKFLTESAAPQEILFCGNWGDPIYSKDFIGLVAEIKKVHKRTRVIIHTNASGKTPEWWERLAMHLNHKDIIFFSIDGTPKNYTNYRINSVWEDVETAIKSCVKVNKQYNKNITMIWKHLVFSYNENTIMEAYNKSQELGIDFNLQESMVFGEQWENDIGGGRWLRPTRPFSEIEKEFNDQKNKSVL